MYTQGKRKQGIPKANWRRTVKKEIKGLTWGEVEIAAGQNWFKAESGGLMLRAELRARRRKEEEENKNFKF